MLTQVDHLWRYAGCTPEELIECFESEQQDIQEICYSSAHMKALSMLRGGGRRI